MDPWGVICPWLSLLVNHMEVVRKHGSGKRDSSWHPHSVVGAET